MTASITRSDVQAVYGEKSPALSTSKQDTLTNHAESITNNNFGGRVARQSEIEGDEDIFAAYVGAHLWSIAEGQSLNEEFQTGNSAAPSVPNAGDHEAFLSTTFYGQVALGMLRGAGTSISIVRSDI